MLGHADNRVGRPDDGTAMIDPQRLSGVSLVKKTPDGALVYIGAGTRVCDVNQRLWQMELALPNMGSFDQQYFAGAVGTGTHGSGASLGPFADLLRSVDLVDGTGQPWRIEDPAQPPTTKAAFAASNREQKARPGRPGPVALGRGARGGARLRHRDGPHGSGQVQAVGDPPREHLRGSSEHPRTVEETLAAVRHWEALICPYASKDGTHFAVITRRDIATKDLGDVPVPPLTDDADKLPPSSRHFQHELQRAFRRFVVTTVPLGQWIVHHPDQAGGLLRFAMNNLIPKQQRAYDFVDRSYRILLLGIGARAHGYEMAVPLENVNNVVKVILSVAAAWNHPDKDKHDRCVFTSPFSLRFVKSGPQFIGTNGHERVGAPPSDIWCFIEIPGCGSTTRRKRSANFRTIRTRRSRSIWGACRAFGARPHWGQQEFMLAT